MSRQEIIDGYHEDAGSNSMLIQIVDVFDKFPIPRKDFRVVYQFKFDDVEDGPTSINDQQAKEIAGALLHAKDQGMNVIVHCFAGLCRSGAVVDVALELGFNPPDRARFPNSTVRQKLRKELGLAINETTSAFRPKLEDWMYD